MKRKGKGKRQGGAVEPLSPITPMKAPMGDGLRPAVDDTPTEQLFEGVEQGKERALEFIGRAAPPLVEADESHAGKRYCRECEGWRPDYEFGRECSWLCRRHWLQMRASYMRHYRTTHKTDKKARRQAKRKTLKAG